MVCKHLSALEEELIDRGFRETFRGEAWGSGAREWVYFDCVLDLTAIRKRIAFAECVVDHEHYGTHDGQESGFVCSQCQDGIMGIHPKLSLFSKHNYPVFD